MANTIVKIVPTIFPKENSIRYNDPDFKNSGKIGSTTIWINVWTNILITKVIPLPYKFFNAICRLDIWPSLKPKNISSPLLNLKLEKNNKVSIIIKK